MSIGIGTQLGPLEVLALLGKGGMGEVYRARDTRLKRDVAIKVLPQEFSADPDRVTRFQREAEALASLNHPNIASIHDLQESDGSRYLVLELIDGDTIADRLDRGPIPWREALSIAKAICEALEAAHEKGVIHRDLKPANIKITVDGRVKVLDFGLAKIYEPAAGPRNVSNSPTISAMQTAGGVILGTAAYMSPEQARGKNVDKRTDVWAFGCVLYEMLTAKRCFDGEDVTDVIAAVVRAEPDWRKLPPETPPSIRKLLSRCLEKDGRERLPDIGTARLEIKDALAIPAQVETKTEPTAIAPLASTNRVALAWSLAAAFAVTAGVMLVLWSPWRASLPTTPVRVNADLAGDVSLAINVQGNAALAISPDGKVVAFVGEKGGVSQLYLRRLDQLTATPLAGTIGAINPFFSPDGQWIGFFADAKLKKTSVSGGGSVPLCDAPAGRGGSWADDNIIIFHADALTNSALHKVSSNGGKAESLTTLEKDEQTHRWPQILPGGKAFIYTSSADRSTFEEANIVVQTIPAGVPKVVVYGGYHAQYVSSGHLFYIRNATLFAAPFDLSRLETSGPAVPVVEGVFTEVNTASTQFAVSNTGTLVYLPGQSIGASNPLMWIGKDGKTAPLRSTPMYWMDPHFSPKGDKLAVDAGGKNGFDVWVYEMERDVLTPLTSNPRDDRWPVWTPDGRRIVFGSQRDNTNGLYWQYADGKGEAQRLTERSAAQQLPWSWDPKGKYLAFQESRSGTSIDIMILPMEGDEASGWKPGKPTAFLDSTATETEPMFSPDGRWIAYTSNESTRNEVSVRPFPGPGPRVQISTNGGSSPVWSPKRHELLYVAGDFRIMSVAYSSEGDSFTAMKPRVWSEQQIATRLRTQPFALDLNSERIVAAPANPTSDNRRVVFVFNYFDELRRIASPKP